MFKFLEKYFNYEIGELNINPKLPRGLNFHDVQKMHRAFLHDNYTRVKSTNCIADFHIEQGQKDWFLFAKKKFLEEKIGDLHSIYCFPIGYSQCAEMSRGDIWNSWPVDCLPKKDIDCKGKWPVAFTVEVGGTLAPWMSVFLERYKSSIENDNKLNFIAYMLHSSEVVRGSVAKSLAAMKALQK